MVVVRDKREIMRIYEFMLALSKGTTPKPMQYPNNYWHFASIHFNVFLKSKTREDLSERIAESINGIRRSLYFAIPGGKLDPALQHHLQRILYLSCALYSFPWVFQMPQAEQDWKRVFSPTPLTTFFLDRKGTWHFRTVMFLLIYN